MTIDNISDILLRWTHSCEKEEQVDLLEEVVPTFFKRFEGQNSMEAIQRHKDFLRYEMNQQKLIIKRIELFSKPLQHEKV